MPLPVYSDVTPEQFRTVILPAAEPALLKGLVKTWPMVADGLASDEALIGHLKAHDGGEKIGVYVGAPEIEGRFFYGKDTRSDNFRFGPAPLGQALDQLLAAKTLARPQSIYVQSAPVTQYLPGLAAQTALDLLPGVAPRIWIGNRVVTRAHYDLNHNIACVVAGKRRVYLFPPEQLPNLYPGPFDRTIGGVPVSMVDILNPDLDRYPRFAAARETMLVAELEPGDGLYIPYGWWHEVHSLSPFNVLVNYWWDDAQPAAQGYDALFHAILAIRDMPKDHHRLWRAIFDHYVFGDDPVAHLGPHDKGSLGPLTPELVRRIKNALVTSLS